MPEMRSARRLRDYLARHAEARPVALTDALYHAQVRYTCDLLDLVDEVADPGTAERITDAICERLAGPAVTEAAKRAAQEQKDYEALAARAGWPSWTWGRLGKRLVRYCPRIVQAGLPAQDMRWRGRILRSVRC